MKPKSVSFDNKNLREAVERQLDYDPAVPSNNIEVSVSDGVVSLSGFVDTYADKIFAERAAKRVRGVVGSHGFRRDRRQMIGSVSLAVASLASCSVEIVPCHAE